MLSLETDNNGELPWLPSLSYDIDGKGGRPSVQFWGRWHSFLPCIIDISHSLPVTSKDNTKRKLPRCEIVLKKNITTQPSTTNLRGTIPTSTG